MPLEIIHDEKRRRFFVTLENEECFVSYSKPSENIMDLEHTIVPRILSGRGIAAELVKNALDYAEKNNFKIYDSCSYVTAYIKKHPEYKKLVK